MKIYVASSWRNRYQPSVIENLRHLGHEVYDFRNPGPGKRGFQWSEIDPEWQTWTPEEYKVALCHPIAQAGFELDADAMRRADVCVLVLPCGRSAHAEFGWMVGAGKGAVIYIPEPCEPELMYLIAGQAPRFTIATALADVETCVLEAYIERAAGGKK